MSAGPEGPVSPHRIVLTGFMGAGKSTVGRLLAARLHWPFYDIDSLVAAEQGLSVADIFAQQGEEYFRRLEAAAIARMLIPATSPHQHPHAVIALGGGAIETESIRELLFPASGPASGPVTIFLHAPLPELLTRCRIDPGDTQTGKTPTHARPLLAAAEPPEARLARRLPHYSRAHLTVDTADIPPAAVVDRILAWLAERTSAS